MADSPVARPFRENDLADELRLHPVSCTPKRALGRRIERTLFLFERVELATQVDRTLVGKAGADLSAEDQPLAIVVADQKRPEPGPRSRAR